jgi:hypothetical protein
VVTAFVRHLMLIPAGTQHLPVLITEALAFIVYPLIMYVVVYAAAVSLQRCTLRAVQSAFQGKAGTPCMRYERGCRMGAAVATQTFITALILWILMVGPIALPTGLDPFHALEVARQNLLTMLERMDLDWTSQSVSAGLRHQWAVAAMEHLCPLSRIPRVVCSTSNHTCSIHTPRVGHSVYRQDVR